MDEEGLGSVDLGPVGFGLVDSGVVPGLGLYFVAILGKLEIVRRSPHRNSGGVRKSQDIDRMKYNFKTYEVAH